MENEKLAVFDILLQMVCSTLIYQRPLRSESAFFHSINLPFDAEVAENFLKGF